MSNALTVVLLFKFALKEIKSSRNLQNIAHEWHNDYKCTSKLNCQNIKDQLSVTDQIGRDYLVTISQTPHNTDYY